MCSSVVERYPDKIEVEGPIPSTPTNIFMAIFSKIDKEILSISIVATIVILLLSFTLYKYVTHPTVKVQNLTGGAQTEIKTQQNP